MIKRLIEWFDGIWNHKQCCHASDKEKTNFGYETSFCVKYKGHFGRHEKGNGEPIEVKE